MDEKAEERLRFERSPKRIRVMVNGKTVADTLVAELVLEKGHQPVYYFPREDVRMDYFERSEHRSACPFKGDARYWHLNVGARRVEDAIWSYEEPLPAAEPIRQYLAFYWDKVDHWFEEDEEVFGHPRDPYHRIDIRPSSRVVRVAFGGRTIALSRRVLMLFETGLPPRYYFPRDDVALEYLEASQKRTTCPYKGEAHYYSLFDGTERSENAVWSYPEPLPENPRIKNYLCFHPDKIHSLEVEGEL